MTRSLQFKLSAAAIAAMLATAAHADNFTQSYEKAGAENTTVQGSTGVVRFDSRPVGTAGFNANFQNVYSGTYTSVETRAADQFGGAGGAGNYLRTNDAAGYSLTLNKAATFFGYWLSAADSTNTLTFYSGATQVGSVGSLDLVNAIASDPSYLGNPDAPFKGQNNKQQYVFVNFFDTNGSFDRVVFGGNTKGSGYESDNHTVGTYTAMAGTPVIPSVVAVPEPSAYALMLLGLAGVGFIARRRQQGR